MPDLLVGQEKYCDFHTIQDAVNAAERMNAWERVKIVILPGVYMEAVQIYRSQLSLIGLGQVEIRMNRCAQDRGEDEEPMGTFATPTLFLGGSDLVLENLTVANTAGQGEHVGQALAVYAHCDRTVFRNCTLRGHQDTLFTGPLPSSPRVGGAFGGIPVREQHAQYRQLYLNCRIEGTVDFIFGGATAYFEHCEIHSLRHAKENHPGYITAASTPPDHPFGYVFKNCYLTAANGVPKGSVFLGRPWREYAKTVFVNCRMGRHIHPLGWDNWGNAANEATVQYAEYGVTDSHVMAGRVKWAVCSEQGGELLTKEKVLALADPKGEESWWRS